MRYLRYVAVGLVLAVLAVAGGVPRARAASCPWMNASLSPDTRAQMLLKAMSLADKIAMVHQQYPLDYHYGAAGWIPANPSLCIPDLVLNDAGQGVGDGQTATTAFPAPISQASSWDSSLQFALGAAVGREAWEKGIDVWLAPGIETDRVPMNGRNWEYGGEDPYLNGQTGVAEVRGVQSEHVIATLKHYVANSQETDRGSSGAADSSDVDERTLEEMYAPQYEAGIQQGGAGSVMCSYNRINSVYACENPSTLGILDRQFGFKGFVMSDWGAQHSTVASAKAGLDMEMNVSPGTYYGSALQSAVQSGQVPMSTLDEMVRRILRSMFAVGVFDHPPAAQPAAYSAPVSTPAHVELARRVSEEGTVLLKNQGSVLPVTGQGRTIAVIGPAASQTGAENEYNGEGSGHIPEAGVTAAVSPQQAITQRGGADGDTVLYADGSSTADAIAAAKAASVAVVFIGDSESEGIDRKSLTISKSGSTCTLVGCTPGTVDQDALVSQVAAANPNTVVVLDTGGPVLMPWLNQVKGLFEAWYPGQEDGNAIAALLFGDVDPSARLTETFPAAQKDIPEQTPAQWPGVDKPGDAVGPHSSYSEGLLVGYRWYDAKHLTPLFPFGYGLDYTTFRYSGLRVRSGHGALATVTFTVTNTGTRQGADVPQLYVGDPAAAGEPPWQLKGFSRVVLAPGASTRVTLPIDARALSWWSTARHAWSVSRGCYTVALGHDERDLVEKTVMAVDGASCSGAAVAVRIPSPSQLKACSKSGPVKGRALGPVALGMTRAQARRQFARFSLRGRRFMDFMCTGQNGIRIGYPSSKLLATLSRSEQRQVRGRVVLILTSSREYSLRGVPPGARLAGVAGRLHVSRPYRVGANTWYFVPDGRVRGVLKVRHGIIQEVGIASPAFGTSRREARVFFSSFT